MAYTTRWLENGFYAKYTGTLTFADLKGVNESFFEDERATHVKFKLHDFMDVKTFVLEELDPNYFAVTDKGSNSYIKEIKSALVVKDLAAQQLCKEYIKKSEELGSTWTTKLFDNLTEAQEWVNS